MLFYDRFAYLCLAICLLLRLSITVTARRIAGLNRFHVAPMQCYTNTHLRYFLRQLSPSTVLWTEMEKVQDLLKSESALKRRLQGSNLQAPVVLQLGGSDPDMLRRAANQALPYGFNEVNLNCGCPTTKSGGNAGYGAELMRNPELVAQCVSALVAASDGEVPVSVKCRINAHANLMPGDVLPSDDYDKLAAFVRACESAGASHIILHARSAILSMQPLKNRDVPPLRPEWGHRLAEEFPNLRITLNGGITSEDELRHAATQATPSGVDGMMAGRWILRDPFALASIETIFKEEDQRDTSSADLNFKETAIAALSKYKIYAEELLQRKEYPPKELALPLILAHAAVKERLEVAKQVSWSTPIPYSKDFWAEIRANLGREEDPDDVVKTQIGVMPMNAFAIYSGDALKNFFPICVQIKVEGAVDGAEEILDALWGAIYAIAWPGMSASTVANTRPSVKNIGKVVDNLVGKKVAKKIRTNRMEGRREDLTEWNPS